LKFNVTVAATNTKRTEYIKQEFHITMTAV